MNTKTIDHFYVFYITSDEHNVYERTCGTEQVAKERAKEFMRKHENFIWNATNITAQMRMQLIELFESYGGKVTIIYVEVPYKTLLKQNNKREEIVPEAILEKMIGKWEPPVREEACHVNFIV